MFFNLFKKRSECSSNNKLFYTTDIHSHILPGIDDGSPNCEVSLILIEAMRRWGIEHIVTTPHVTEESFENTPETIGNAYNRLMEAMKGAGVEIPIDYSAEYRIDGNFKEVLASNSIIPLPNDYILIENSFIQPPIDLMEIIFELQLRDLKPILAHPERYVYYHNKKEIYTKLNELRCNLQVNILSIAGYYGDKVKDTALWLIERGYVQFIGTDLHHFDHIAAIDKFLSTKEYAKIAKRLAPIIENHKLNKSV